MLIFHKHKFEHEWTLQGRYWARVEDEEGGKKKQLTSLR
jgi:hypothetical protein